MISKEKKQTYIKEMTTQFDVRPEKIKAVWEAFLGQICPLFQEEENQGFFKTTLSGEEMLLLLGRENNFYVSTLFVLYRVYFS